MTYENDIKLKSKIINEVCKKYLEIKEILTDTPKTKVSKKIHNSYKKHMKKIDVVLALLPKQEYEYIIKTFITKVHTNWWNEKYELDEYEKLENASINRFLFLYLI